MDAILCSWRDLVVSVKSVVHPGWVYLLRLSRPHKAAVFSATVCLALLAIIAQQMKRSKRPRPGQSPYYNRGNSLRTRGNYRRLVAQDDFSFRGGGGDAYKFRNTSSSICSDQKSTSTLITMLAGDASVGTGVGNSPCTAQQLGLLGLEALETAIGYWEDAEVAFSREAMTGSGQLALTNKSEAELGRQLQVLLEKAFDLQDAGETLFLHEGSLLFSREESLATPRMEGGMTRTLSYSSDGCDSFHSALSDMSDELLEVEGSLGEPGKLALYRLAKAVYEESGIPTRGLYTEIVGLTSDDDYRVKVHCLRLGFQYVFEQDTPRRWFADAGFQILSDLFVRAEKDPREMQMSFEELVNYLMSPNGRRIMTYELKAKGYYATTFFDVVIENLLEAFIQIESPPGFVLAVTNNRWLSSRFKESGLTASLWSIIKARKRTLENPEGYLTRYYDLLAHAAPVVVWGFLGTDIRLNQICNAMKDEFSGYVNDIFNVRKVRYTTVEELSQDLWKLAKLHHDLLVQRLAL
ncbi:unnamed protein product [Notodromas monacha]|uniref:Uncharacterized protein n=1 Tax=Notodromas monacha TaxID=399045 RepID=A0A7R9BWF0_9CRUS|nr:unnamed protein product [Notodromas monacha]CAG0921367.1 unnamed protein product [Notodromas monacha]